MALLDGKQLRDQSTELGKLSGTGIVSFTSATMSFGAGSVLTTATSNIVNGTDVVNKEYVDSVAAGLDPKESVAYTTTGDITLSGTGTQSGGDWSSALTAGDRILVKNQTDKTQNGIYTVDGGSWSRATDHDGTPANEVTLGNFTFVEYGSLAGAGYVLHATNAATAPIITPGTDEQEWTLFSSAGAYTAGTGLTLTGGEFKITDTAVSAGSYGQANSATTFTVNDQGQLTAAGTTLISITSSQVTDFDAAAETAVFEDANFVDGTTIDFTVTAGDSVTAEVIDSSLQVSKLNTGSFGGATAGYVLSTDGTNFKWILDEGDISAVTAGSGLSGGGTEGDVTLDVNTSNGLSISGDDVVLGGTLSQITTIAGNSQQLVLGLTSSQLTHLIVNSIQGQEKYEVPGQGITIDKNPGGMTSQVVNTSGDIADFTLNAQVTESKTTRTDGTYSTVKTGGSYAFIQTTDGSDFSAINTSLNNIRLEQSVVGTSSFSGLKLDRTTGYKFEDARGGTAAVGIEYAGDYSANFTANSLVTKAYVDSLDAAQITGVTAGAGLSGGGTSGDVTLSVNTSNGLSISGDDVVLGGTLSQATTIAGGGQTLDLGLTSSQITFLRVNAIQAEEKYEVPGQGVTISKNPGGFTSQVDATGVGGFITKIQQTPSTVEISSTVDGTTSDYHAQQFTAASTGSSVAIQRAGIGSTYSEVVTNADNMIVEQTVAGTSSTSGLKLNRTTGYKFEDARGGTAAVGIEYAGDYSANFTANSLVTKAYVDSLDAAQITGVDAGAGLSGGGTAGTVALSVNTDNGLSIDGDNVVLGGTLSQATTIAGAGFDVTINNVDYLTLDSTTAFDVTSNLVSIDSGTGPSQFLSGTDTTISASSSLNLVSEEGTVTTGDGKGLQYTADYSAGFVDNSLITKAYADTKVSGVTAGAGLSGGGTSGDITLNADLTVNGGLTFSASGDAGTIEVVVDNTTIQVIDGALSVVAGASQPVYQSATSSVATGNTGIALSSTPNTYSRIEVYVNGQLQNLTADTTGDCYFGASGTALNLLKLGDSLYWNSANAGFTLSSTDIVKIHYEA